MVFVVFAGFYFLRKYRGGATEVGYQTGKGSSPKLPAEEFAFCCCLRGVHHFDRILVYIILELIFRMLFLSMGFVSKSGGQVRYGEQIYFQVFPFVFTALAIICMQKYKLKVYYQFNCSTIPKSEQRVQQAMTALLFVLMLLLPSISVSRKVSDLAAKTVNLVLQLSFLLALSAISLRLTYKLRIRFDTHNLYFAKSRMFWLEVLIQTIIWTRLLTSTVQIIWPKFFVDDAENQIALMAVSFTLAELVPFCFLVYGIYL